MHAPAAAAAAGTAFTGKWLFDYNRANYQNDVPQRFARFVSSRNMLNAQMGQYRQDVQGIVGVTVAKMDSMQMMITLILCVCAALSDAGRIGMHGCAPPEWLCALYSGHIYSAILFCGTALWLAMHASLRAQCAMVSLLTRKVRLPIPNMAQIDNARGFGSGFENQRLGDIFRVPFMRHPEAAPTHPDQSSDEDEETKARKEKDEKEGKKGKKKGATNDVRTEFGSTTRDTVPSWIRDEQVVDKGTGSSGVSTEADVLEPHEIPEHFKMIAKAQEEWWQYDVYARVLTLYGVMQFLGAVTYYSIGTTMSELRGFWIAWSLPMLFLIAQALILRLDIVQSNGNHVLPHAEWAGHIAPYFAIAACTLEFRYTYSHSAVVCTWALVFLCYFGHMLLACRMLDLAWPDWARTDDLPDEPGRGWWPSSWKIPSAFGKNLWLIAPPKKLEPGQHDLLHEMDALVQTAGGVSCRRRRGSGGKKQPSGKRPSSPQALKVHVAKLRRLFQWWFDDSVWAQVPEKGQRRLSELWTQFEMASRQVSQVAGDTDGGRSSGYESTGSGGPPTVARVDYEQTGFGEPVKYYYDKNSGNTSWEVPKDTKNTTSIGDVEKKMVELADMLIEIGEGLTDVEATNRKQMSVSSSPGGFDGAYTTESPFKDFSKQRAHDLPWQLTRVAICTLIFTWIYMGICLFVEMLVGSDKFMKEPGEPPWIRDQKLRSWKHERFWHQSDEPLPGDYRLFYNTKARDHNRTGVGGLSQYEEFGASHETLKKSGHSGHGGHGGAHSAHRRLALDDAPLDELLKALPQLQNLVHEIEEQQKSHADAAAQAAQEEEQYINVPDFMAPQANTHKVAWPALFEPHHMVCKDNSVAALTSRGFGAIAKLAGLEEEVKSTPFSLDGLAEFGALAGAAWAEDGLHAISKNGDMLHCPGQGPEAGRWSCAINKAMKKLPVAAKLAAAAISHHQQKGRVERVAALVFEHLPGIVSLFKESAHGWSPSGDVHLPPHADAHPVGLSFHGRDLLAMLGKTGEVIRRNVDDGNAHWHSPPPYAPNREFRMACPHKEGLLRLALRQASADAGWNPELIAA
eukprot:TRINITY_DN22689_c0_g1_i1.p1 TRINITY_DN22689_c0_g1~~TRINITY_DN22689_c0_g1_i1.p1  ORF type:complete len:1078 (-),score=278.74 TRINITY_DN22689_c0_g1_i1:342-3575(-)